MGRVPTSLKVLGILGIIYSALGLTCGVAGVLSMFSGMTRDPALERIYSDPTYIIFALVAGVISCILVILLLVSSIGCLKARPWARPGMNTYAIAHVLETVAGSFFNLVYLMPRMNEAMRNTPGLPVGMLETIQIVSVVAGILFSLGVSVTIVIMVNRKIAVDAFHGIFPEDPNSFPLDEYPAPPAV